MTEYRTRQEIFDIAYRGLASQGWKQSSNASGSCAYRGKNGLKCAIGWLIPDEKYKRHMDRGNSSIDHKPSVVNAAGINKSDMSFAVALQMIHDEVPSSELKASMEDFARDYGLTIPEV